MYNRDASTDSIFFTALGTESLDRSGYLIKMSPKANVVARDYAQVSSSQANRAVEAPRVSIDSCPELGMSNDLSSRDFGIAVSSIQKRAEKITEWSRIAELFVPSDVRLRVEATDTQLVLGRRGTGKTHLLKAFQEELRRQGKLVLYYDCTRLGSGYASLRIEPLAIAAKFFSSLLNQIGTDLHDEAIRMERPRPEHQHNIMRKLVDAFVPYMSAAQPGNSGSIYNYAQIGRTLSDVIADLKIGRLFVVIDEWAQIPVKAQPYFAEFLKRSLLIVPSLSVKLLAVNYQCQFSENHDGTMIGMQRGADIPDIVDLDGYLIPIEREDAATEFFAQVLYNHLGVELGWSLDSSTDVKRRTIESLFTQKAVFLDLVRAAEGNCRDFLCIFSRAYFDKFRQSTSSNAISKPNIAQAATEWFDAEKLANIKAEQEIVDTLTFILDEVLKNYKSRTFMVEASKADHPRIVRLLNERVLHKLNGTYSAKDRPGVRFELFSVDFGAFVRYRGTARQIDETVFFVKGAESVQHDDLVPVDDRRSIRRIILDPTEGRIKGFASQCEFGESDLPLWRVSLER